MMTHSACARSFKNVTLQTALAVKSVIFFMVMGFTSSVYAQVRDAANYPDRPIKIVVGFVPGGPTDLYARVAARGLSDVLGQQVVVENKPGASGAIAAVAVAGAAADGYTLLAHVVSDIITPIANNKVGYNLERDFTAIGLIVQELIAYAKKNPNTLNYGSAGVGTVSHLAGALLEAEAQTPLAHIQYKGTNGAQLDLLAGRITVMFDNLGNGLSNAQAGKLKALAVTSAEPWPAAATIPTMAQSGFPGSTILSVFGLVAPVGTPVAVVNKLSAALSQGLRTEAYRKSIIDSGAQPGELAAEAYGKYIVAESRRWESFLAKHPEIMKQ